MTSGGAVVVSGPFVVTRARSPVGVPRRSVVALAVWRVFVVPRWSVVALRGWRAVVVPHGSVGHAAALRFGHLNVTLLVVQATVGTESLSDVQSLHEARVGMVRPRCERLRDRKVGLDGDHGSGA